MLKSPYFLNERKTLDFSIKLAFFIIFTTFSVLKCAHSTKREKLRPMSIFRNAEGSKNNKKC